MSHIFISYANEDRAKARILAQFLENEGWSTFWDRTIPVGMTWQQFIGKELTETRCLVVLWSQASINSTWVQEEADEGKRRGILIPILIEAVLPPFGFRGIQAGDLSDWDGTQATSELQMLASHIKRVIGEALNEDKEPQRRRRPEEAMDKAKEREQVEEEAKRKADAAARRKAHVSAEGSRKRLPLKSLALGLGGILVTVLAAALFFTSYFSGESTTTSRDNAVATEEAPMPAPVDQVAMPESVAKPEAEREYKPGDTFKRCDVCPEMVVVPSGTFEMGSNPSDAGSKKEERPRHPVNIASPFAVGVFPVTFQEWEYCVSDGGCNGYHPPHEGWGRGQRPVIHVSWNDAQTYVAWLSKKTGDKYRLLTESEREYVARAETESLFFWGDSISTDQANYNGNYSFNGSDKGEYRKKTLPVGSFDANP